MTANLLTTRQNYTELPVHPTAVSLARRHVAQVLTDWDRDALIDDARLVISELVTNGIKASDPSDDEIEAYGTLAGAYRRVRIGLHQTAGGVVLEAWDCNRCPPRLCRPDAEAVGGRGLLVVDTVATQWGYRWPKTGGKIVWALLGDAS
ncbi:ATP-binding protein [Nonomuraea sp. NPDC048826]|uniref:ATP-binding protein n=1 Tax=Nonomuraea sp. NPDC048826 TaxID=3364347 RepID=UPI003720137B